jgi:hypothetical protein
MTTTTNSEQPWTDEQWIAAIAGERDPMCLLELIHKFYGVPDRADRQSRSLLFLHLGHLSGMIMRLVYDEATR